MEEFADFQTRNFVRKRISELILNGNWIWKSVKDFLKIT